MARQANLLLFASFCVEETGHTRKITDLKLFSLKAVQSLGF